MSKLDDLREDLEDVKDIFLCRNEPTRSFEEFLAELEAERRGTFIPRKECEPSPRQDSTTR